MNLRRHRVQHSGIIMTLLSIFVLLCMSVNALALAMCPHMLGGVCWTLKSSAHALAKQPHCASMSDMSMSDAPVVDSVESNESIDVSVIAAAPVATSSNDGCTHCLMQNEYGRERTLNAVRLGSGTEKVVDVESGSTPVALAPGFPSLHIRDHDPPGLVVPIYVRINLYRI
jgi:hypothetical protein